MSPSNKTLYEYFAEFSALRGDAVFLFDENTSYTVKKAFDISKNLASQIYACGVRRGDFVAVKADRTVKTVLVYFALQFLGAVAVMRDPRDEILENKIIADDIFTVDGETTTLKFTDAYCIVETSSDSKAPTAVIFTSGSTGNSKAVKLSQYNFINNALDTRDIGGYKSDDINMLIVPIHHVFGLALIMIAVVVRHSIFVPNKIDADYVVDCMEKYGVTRLNGVPSMYLALAARKGNRKLNLNCGFIGGGPCTQEQFAKIENTLGIKLLPVYGMSECIGISCGSYNDSIDNRANSVGRVYSMNTVKIAGDGEVLVKSPAMSCGYIDSKVCDDDGWLHTGDLGCLDEDGYLHITGRKKDIIIRNGNNLSVVEIERKILSISGIKDVCVVGIPDSVCGEVPCALIVGVEHFQSEVYGKVLTKIEMPARFIYTESIPLTSTGKQDKQGVRAMFLSNDSV